MRRASRLSAVLALTLAIAACTSPPQRREFPTNPGPGSAPPARAPARAETRPLPPPQPRTPQVPAPATDKDGPPDVAEIPYGLDALPDAVPQFEPYSRYGNPPTYEVFGESYEVMGSARGYRETGLASWYGKKFHGKRTSSGEPYDMFKLTAAHKSLPLPSYARVTHLTTGKSVIVRINDRGPFHSGRIIDLSFAAATKLGTVGGVGMVEVEAIVPGKPLPAPPMLLPVTPPKDSRGYLQVAAFSDPINAISLREELLAGGVSPIEIRTATLDGLSLYRVLIGPFKQPEQLAQVRGKLAADGYESNPVGN